MLLDKNASCSRCPDRDAAPEFSSFVCVVIFLCLGEVSTVTRTPLSGGVRSCCSELKRVQTGYMEEQLNQTNKKHETNTKHT